MGRSKDWHERVHIGVRRLNIDGEEISMKATE